MPVWKLWGREIFLDYAEMEIGAHFFGLPGRGLITTPNTLPRPFPIERVYLNGQHNGQLNNAEQLPVCPLGLCCMEAA